MAAFVVNIVTSGERGEAMNERMDDRNVVERIDGAFFAVGRLLWRVLCGIWECLGCTWPW
jgi:hypothetical protein